MKKSLQQQLTQKAQNLILASTGAPFLPSRSAPKRSQNRVQKQPNISLQFMSQKCSQLDPQIPLQAAPNGLKNRHETFQVKEKTPPTPLKSTYKPNMKKTPQKYMFLVIFIIFYLKIIKFTFFGTSRRNAKKEPKVQKTHFSLL